MEIIEKNFPEQLDAPVFYSEFEPAKSEISNAIFQDELVYRISSENGFIQFARHSYESYDLICFDTRKKKSNHDFQLFALITKQFSVMRKFKL